MPKEIANKALDLAQIILGVGVQALRYASPQRL